MQEEAICFRLVWQGPMAGAKQWVHASARQCREGAAPASIFFFRRQLSCARCLPQATTNTILFPAATAI